MKWQTNGPLGPYINHWGCHFCSILQKVEKMSKGAFKWTNEQIVEIQKNAIHLEFLTPDIEKDGKPFDGCTVLYGDKIFNIAAEYAGIEVRAKGYRHEEWNYQPNANEEEILELKRDGYAGSHFVSGNNVANQKPWTKEIEYDGIEGGSRCAQEGWIASKRIMSF